MTATRSLPAQSEDAAPEATKKRFGLSLTQIVAAGFASITATVILSFFSISGTLIGAAVFSMASAVGNAVYGQSLRSTKDKVKDAVPFGKADPSSPTVVLPTVDDAAVDETPPADDEDLPPALPARAPNPQSPKVWKRIALFAAGIFVFVIAVITSVELIAGRPLTDVLRGDTGSGTSLFGGTSNRNPVPVMTVTVTPHVVVTTPTVTQTAPPATKTQTPTGTVTTTQAPSSSTSSSGTGSASPSESPSTSPSTTPSSAETLPRN